MKRDGFTLIELLVTLVLIILLYLATYSWWSKNYQERQKLACQKNLQLIHVALQIYADEQRGAYPLVPGAATAEIPLSLLVPRYTAATGLFICPGSKDSPLREAQPFPGQKISFAYYMGHRANDATNQVLLTDRQVDTSTKVQSQLVFSPDGKKPGNNHHRYGGNFLFGDGHVEPSPPHAARDLPIPPNVVLLNPQP